MSWAFEYWTNGRVMAKRDNAGKFVEGHRHYPKDWGKNISKAQLGKKYSLGYKQTKKHKESISKSITEWWRKRKEAW